MNTQSLSQVSATHLKIGYQLIKSTGVQSLNVTVSVWHDFKIEHKDTSYHNYHQGNMPHGNSFTDFKKSLNWNRTPVICFNEVVLLLTEQLVVYTSPEINAECLGDVRDPVSI